MNNDSSPEIKFTQVRDLEKQLKSLQKAFAEERGESHRFRELVRAYLE